MKSNDNEVLVRRHNVVKGVSEIGGTHKKEQPEGFLDIKSGLFPLHSVAMDYTCLDVLINDGITGKILGRAWLYVTLDLYSNCVWSLTLGLNSTSASECLLSGMEKKNSKEQYNTIHEWDVYGKPYNIIVDRIPYFESDKFISTAIEVIGAKIQYRPIRLPNYSGVTERFFSTLQSELISRLPKTSEQEYPTYTLDELRRIITTYVVDVYHYQPHGDLPEYSNIPMIRYAEGIRIMEMK